MLGWEISDGIQTSEGSFTHLASTYHHVTAQELAKQIAAQNGETVHIWFRRALTVVLYYGTVDTNGNLALSENFRR